MTSPLKILIITGQLGMGGTERQLFHLLHGIHDGRFVFKIVNFSAGGGYYWQEQLHQLGIPIVEIKDARSAHRIWLLRRLAKAWRADVIFSANFFMNGYAAATAKLTAAAAVGSLRNSPNKAHVGHLPLYWRLLCTYGVDELVCNSQVTANDLCGQYRMLSRVRVIPNGVNVPDEAAINTWRASSKAVLSWREPELIVGFVGFLGPQKNVQLLIRAFGELAGQFTTGRLVIVGDGPARTELETLVAALALQKRVQFLGRYPLAEQLMPAFDTLCLPSDYEGMPNVLLEAGAVGLPVVASRVAGIPEVVLDGETGILFPAGDLNALIECLRKILSDSRTRCIMGNAARKRMQDEYSVELLVARYSSLFESLSEKAHNSR